MSSDIARLAARVAALERQLARTTRTARMAYSSIEDGAIEVYDQDGTLRGSMGLQDDGTIGFVAHNGPAPPTPTPPVVESAFAGLTITWPGTWADAETAPLSAPPRNGLRRYIRCQWCSTRNGSSPWSISANVSMIGTSALGHPQYAVWPMPVIPVSVRMRTTSQWNNRWLVTLTILTTSPLCRPSATRRAARTR